MEGWETGVWLQDTCSHFGGWPVLLDAIVGIRGAWPLFLVTGNTEFLAWAYQVTIASLQRAEEEEEALDRDTGLFLGCSSFLESNSGYPEEYGMYVCMCVGLSIGLDAVCLTMCTISSITHILIYMSIYFSKQKWWR